MHAQAVRPIERARARRVRCGRRAVDVRRLEALRTRGWSLGVRVRDVGVRVSASGLPVSRDCSSLACHRSDY